MYVLAIICEIILILSDRLTKYLAYSNLRSMDNVKLIDGIFQLTYVENRGAAFGILQGARWLFLPLTVIIITAIGYYFIKMPKTKVYNWVRVSLVLISSGAIGNFIDRLVNGYVVDFFHFYLIDFPVFNVADVYVVTGSILLGVLFIFFVKDEGGSTEKAQPSVKNIESETGESN